MNELIAMVWDTETLVTIAIVGYVLGFLFKSQITLRMLVLVASLFYIAYYYYHPAEPLWGAIWGSVLIIVANLIGLFAFAVQPPAHRHSGGSMADFQGA